MPPYQCVSTFSFEAAVTALLGHRVFRSGIHAFQSQQYSTAQAGKSTRKRNSLRPARGKDRGLPRA